MEFRILDWNYVFDPTVGILASSSDSEFPASNLRDPSLARPWRSSGTFVIDSTNQYIDFKESAGGSELTAVIIAGTYTPTTLAAAVKAALEIPGAETYTVSYSATTGKWTIAHAGTELQLLFSSGSHAATSARAALGFGTNDYSGAVTHTGALISIHTEESLEFDLRTWGCNPFDSFAVLFDPTEGVKFTDDAVLKLQANQTPYWAAPGVDLTLSLDQDFSILTYAFAAVSNYRYCRLKIVDPQNPNLYVEIPKVILAKSTQLTKVPRYGSPVVMIEDRTIAMENEYGHKYFDLNPRRRRVQYGITGLTDADQTTLQQIYNRVGTSMPICVWLDPRETKFSNKDNLFTYGRLAGGFELGNLISTFFDYAMEIEEAL